MSSHQHPAPLDPRLGAPQDDRSPPITSYGQQHPPRPLQPHGLPYDQPPPQPYYNQYPDIQARDQAAYGATSTGIQSTHNSPHPIGYRPPREASEHSGDDGNEETQHVDDPKRPRACEACRGLKVRCDQDPARPEVPCRRCQKAGRPCVITAPTRKRMKKSDSRVAELERKLDALTSVLQQQNGQIPLGQQFQSFDHNRTNSASAQSDQSPSASSSMQPPQKRQRVDDSSRQSSIAAYGPSANSQRHQSTSSPAEVEVWPRLEMPSSGERRSQEDFLARIHSLISPDVAATVFDRYVNKMSPNMPAVIFPPTTTAKELAREKPILYVCVLSAASFSMLGSEICRGLAREAVRAIADCVVVNGAKSLELIQAMQVMVLFYRPPDKSEQSNYYQITHMAAVMAMDIGLGKRYNAPKTKRGLCPPGQPLVSVAQNSDTIEARRAWLCCYYMSASTSMVLRRPNLIHWSNYMKECVEILETSPEAFPSDRLLCQHIKIQHICEEIGVQFLMDDNTATISITDPKVAYTLKVLENDLKAWKDNIPAELKGHPTLTFFEHVANLYLHEIALHFNHNVEDFRLPFTEESLRNVNNSSETLTSHQVAALIACKKAAHGILDTFLAIDRDTVKALPILLYFVRCTYSMVILIKMHVATTTPGSEISKMMSPDDLKVDTYLTNLTDMFIRIANDHNIRPKPKILRILDLLMTWFRKHQANVEAQARGEQVPPAQQSEQTQREDAAQRPQYTQSPLDLLSQVATGNRQSHTQPPPLTHENSNTSSSRSWTFNSSSYPMDQTTRPSLTNAEAQFSPYAQQQISNPYANDAYPGMDADLYGMVDSYVWGSGFQQAMDLNLDGFGGGGIDGLFMGDGMLPFGGNGEMG
ncbi:unnamed protein product [Zymoseptoria tritici ST99CH_1E4]|nr:unnamed protein product [Zymoseptoria tritici ST99CH_1E4]